MASAAFDAHGASGGRRPCCVCAHALNLSSPPSVDRDTTTGGQWDTNPRSTGTHLPQHRPLSQKLWPPLPFPNIKFFLPSSERRTITTRGSPSHTIPSFGGATLSPVRRRRKRLSPPFDVYYSECLLPFIPDKRERETRLTAARRGGKEE